MQESGFGRRRKIRVEDLKIHARDIIEGRFSRNNVPDQVMIEERVKLHPKFRKISKGGGSRC